MATRRDQLQSYQFLLQRVISSLVMRETDPFQSPLRRGTGAIFAGVMIAVIVAVGFGVAGMLTKMGDSTWNKDGSTVVEKETGAVYVYRNKQLHPMLNYASALLAGKGASQVFQVSSNSLSKVPRGTTLGIPEAPMSLPAADKVVKGGWSLCSIPSRDDAGNAKNKTNVVAGATPTGGSTLGDEGMLAKDIQTDMTYLIWHSHRYQITGDDDAPAKVIETLFTTNQDPALVGTAWLNALPKGADIGPVPIVKKGSASTAVPSLKNGDLVYDMTGSGPQYYLVLDDGLARLTAMQLPIMKWQTGSSPKPMSVSDATNATKSSAMSRAAGAANPPTRTPKLVGVDAADNSCAIFSDGKETPKIVVGGTFTGIGTGIPTPAKTKSGTSLADLVTVPAGRVAVVRTMASDTAPAGTYDLVTDGGKRYPVLSVDVLKQLGYSTDDAVSMPSGLILRIPAGPTLDPKAAMKPPA